MSEICVWESKHGWKVVEAFLNSDRTPYQWVVMQDGMNWKDAVAYAERLRKSTGLS